MRNSDVTISKKQLRAAIIGSGNIGMDILMKLKKSSSVCCSWLIGRNPMSENLQLAKAQGVNTTAEGIKALESLKDEYDIVFDATSANDHIEHAILLKRLGKQVIDLTPAKIGEMCVPVINLDKVINKDNINMVTCGGQAAIPICYALSKVFERIPYIEVVSSISSKSAGPATRANLDEYILTTERAITVFSGACKAKAILNINPATPEVTMKTTIFAYVENPDVSVVKKEVIKMITRVQNYMPHYQLVLEPYFDGSKLSIILEVTGAGDYLPEFAGNYNTPRNLNSIF
ncbi:acetaldehyde dehydrogenase (acetylating) [Cysteiniphilum litorale]|uniref:Acetaldehyde dehydrogenase n=2 Tax=Cysteiniphilum TaxID=2056696 RepID=A0A8J2Z6B7_9GAMM|nr:acetaldehyde dehydrogenase (acetylating) [Cysteiniphilum litorale]GGG05573.1 acetaldehyde dehydrogenase [Cysteiniphilum litorale]